MKRPPLPPEHRIAALVATPDQSAYALRCECGWDVWRATVSDAREAHHRHATGRDR